MDSGSSAHEGDHDPLTKLNAAINLTKAMPPSKLKKNLIGLISLAPEIEDNLLEKIELPMCTLAFNFRNRQQRSRSSLPED